MRTNKFGEKYCNTADEARRVIDNSDNGWEVYACAFSPAEKGSEACAEVHENASGDIVCYIEAKTLKDVRAIVAELKLESQD